VASKSQDIAQVKSGTAVCQCQCHSW